MPLLPEDQSPRVRPIGNVVVAKPEPKQKKSFVLGMDKVLLSQNLSPQRFMNLIAWRANLAPSEWPCDCDDGRSWLKAANPEIYNRITVASDSSEVAALMLYAKFLIWEKA